MTPSSLCLGADPPCITDLREGTADDAASVGRSSLLKRLSVSHLWKRSTEPASFDSEAGRQSLTDSGILSGLVRRFPPGTPIGANSSSRASRESRHIGLDLDGRAQAERAGPPGLLESRIAGDDSALQQPTRLGVGARRARRKIGPTTHDVPARGS